MQEYNRVENLIEDLYQIIEEYRGGGLFGGKYFDKEDAIDILEEIRNNLPREINDAKKIIKNANKIKEDAEKEAMKIIRMAEEQAQIIVSEHNILKLAEEQAQIAKKEASEFYIATKTAAVDYADASMAKGEKSLQITLEEISNIFKEIEHKISNEIDNIYGDRNSIKDMQQNFVSELDEIFRNIR